MTEKRCLKCRLVKPIEMFSRKSAAPDGHQNSCKACMSAYRKTEAARARDRQRYARLMATDPVKRRRQSQRWKAANRESVLASIRKQNQRQEIKDRKAAWVAEDRRRNPERYTKAQSLYRQRHAEAIRARRELRKARDRDANRAYRDAHRDELNAKNREYRQRNLERERARSKRYQQRRPEVGRKNCQSRRARVAGVFVEHVDILTLYRRDRGICGICLLPVTRAEASHDHIVPVAKGGEHSYKNAQLAHLSCNQKKHVKVIGQLRLVG
jgi:5-methylcytosine-specific restriction endonuclease McrA